ncbi:MAG: hypothetical protein JSW61_14930 [Candidatus Thorarchaeota archaeon]|nr:MAG: hypothetical protein JSW61_14930 [Candidatus Thorarchaeota archaeon]
MSSMSNEESGCSGALLGVAVMTIGSLVGFYLFFNALFSDGSVIQAIFTFMFVAVVSVLVGVSIIVRSQGGLQTVVMTTRRERQAVERTYVYEPPRFCSTCGGDLNPQNVEWTGPLTVKCPYCGASHNAIKREV